MRDTGAGGAIGLVLGGILTEYLSWRWCLYANLIFAGLAGTGAALLLRQQRARARTRLDLPGVALVSASMFCLVYGFSNAAARTWHTPDYASAVLGPLMVAGLGFGFTIAPAMNTGTFGVAPQDAGVASVTLNTGQQIGGSIGTSLLNTIFASAVAHYLTSHLSPAALVHGHPAPSLTGMSLIHGYTTGFWAAAAIFGTGAVICGTLFRFGPLPYEEVAQGVSAGSAAASLAGAATPSPR
jgi:MFS family permease